MCQSHHSRYLAISGIAESLVKHEQYDNIPTVNHEKIESALDKYWRKVPIYKEVYGIKNNLDRHKVGAGTTIHIFHEKPIIYPENTQNGHLKIINHLYAVHAGFSNIGNSLLLPDEVVASIISQLDFNECTILSLASQFYLLEELQKQRYSY